MMKETCILALPSYNEEAVIDQVISELDETPFQILVIDDGSTDDTGTIARNKQVIILRHACNRGAGAASQTAIEWARKHQVDYLIFMDADGQHHASDINVLLQALKDGQGDIIIGNRFHQQGDQVPQKRVIYNQLANALTNFFCSKTYQDTQSGFRALNRKAIEKLNLKVDGFGFCSEMIIVGENEGLQIHEVPIRVSYTDYSLSKGQSFGKGITTAIQFVWRILFE